MKMFKCEECGEIFSEEEIAHWSESMGEYWGSPCSQEFAGCPYCHCCGYDEIEPCKICGSYEEKEVGDVCCEDCKKDLVKKLSYIIFREFEEEEREGLKSIWEEIKI